MADETLYGTMDQVRQVTDPKKSLSEGMNQNHKVFNDAVHGHMSFHPLLVKLIDTRTFQRLRNIKQLGFCYYVYPAASHNRFEHSLGTCFMANKLVRALMHPDTNMPKEYRLDSREILCILIAALLHDLGHGPFSHSYEIFMRKAGVHWLHESSSLKMFDYLLKDSEIREEFVKYGLREEHIQLIKDLISPKDVKYHTNKYYIFQIVSNQDNDVDVDKWDYILRDQKMLNINITFDSDRLISFAQVLRVKRNGSKEERTEICFRDKEIANLEQMLYTRAQLHEKAYQHDVVKIVEWMVIDAFLEAHRSCPELELTNTDPEHFLTLTDDLFYRILNSRNPKLKAARDILIRVETRKLYQCIGRLNVDEKKCLNCASPLENQDVLDKLAIAIHEKLQNVSNNNGVNIGRDQIVAVTRKIDMGSKYRAKGPNCFIFKKNSQEPFLYQPDENTMRRQMPIQQRTILILNKGEKISEKSENLFAAINEELKRWNESETVPVIQLEGRTSGTKKGGSPKRLRSK